MITQRLNNNWEYFQGSLGGLWEIWRAEQLANHFNVPWQKVSLPHCFNALDAVDPDKKYYQGPGWYRTKLTVNNPYRDGRTLLHFEGAGQKTDVFVYMDKVGSHLGGYDEFTVDITDAIQRLADHPFCKKQLPLAIRCDNSRDLETIPSDISDFNLYGGLYRYVNLIYVPSVSMERVQVNISHTPGSPARVTIKGRMHNPAGRTDALTMTVTIFDPQGQQVVLCRQDILPWTDTRDLLTETLTAPLGWSPDTPHLYRAEVELRTAAWHTTCVERFGIRSFEFKEHGPFYLNGQRLLLKGTHRHEDHAGLGAAMPEELIRREMRMIKDMGANFIRLGHYQQSRIVLDCCDELGILVWEEIPWCQGGLGSESYKDLCRVMLTNMIDQHYNHPAVIIWGLANEIDWPGDFPEFDPNAIRTFLQELHTLAHTLDPARVTAIQRGEFCKDVVDVYSPSLWAGWYCGVSTEYEACTRTEFEKTPRFLHAEWGADNHTGRHTEKPFTGLKVAAQGRGAAEKDGDYGLSGGDARVSKDGDWSETYFCDMIDWYLKSQISMGWLTGSAQGAFKDFSTPIRPDNPLPFVNQQGVVERDLTPKEAYYVFQSHWAALPMVHIYGHSWPVRCGKDGEKKTVRVYSNCTAVELFLNGQSCGKKQRNAADLPAAGLRWEVVFRKGKNTVEARAEVNDKTIKDKIELLYQTQRWGGPKKFKIRTRRQRGGRRLVTVRVIDKNGCLCADAAFFIRFSLAGAGRLVDNQGTVRGSRRVQMSNGQACILMEPLNGVSVVSVTAPGLRTIFRNIR